MHTVFITPVLWMRFNRAMRRRSEGQAIVLVALTAVAMVAIVGLAIDGGLAFIQAQRLQRATDAAAMAGVVWQPGRFDTAKQYAFMTLRINGYNYPDGDARVVVNPGTSIPPSYSANQLQVTATTTASRFFLGVIGINNYDITRTSVAAFTLPIPMGSRDNTFGGRAPHPDPKNAQGSLNTYKPGGVAICQGTSCPGDGTVPSSANFLRDTYTNGQANPSGFWANIFGPNTKHGNGDAYSSKYGNTPGGGGYSYVANPSGCTYSSNDKSNCNPDYEDNPAGNTQGAGGGGYDYSVVVKSQNYKTNRVVAITAFDGALNTGNGWVSGGGTEQKWTGDNSWGDTNFEAFNSGNMPWSNGNVNKWAEFKTVFTLYPATITPAAQLPTVPRDQKTLSNLEIVLRQSVQQNAQYSDTMDGFRIACSLDGVTISDTIPPASSSSYIDSPVIDPNTDITANPSKQFQTGLWSAIIAQGDNGGRWGDQNHGGCLADWSNNVPTAGSLVAFRDLYNKQVLDIVPYTGTSTSTWGGQTCKSPTKPTAQPCVQLKLVTSSYLPYTGSPTVFHDMRVAGKQYTNYKHTGNVWYGYQPGGDVCCAPLFTYPMRDIEGAGDNNVAFNAPTASIRMNVNVINNVNHDLRTGGGANRYALTAWYMDCGSPYAAYSTCSYVTDAFPQFFALGAMSLYNNIAPNGATSACLNSSGNSSCVNSDFDLAQIPPENAGSTLVVSLFDPGDVSNNLDIGILDPKGNPMTFDATCRYRPPGYNSAPTTCSRPSTPNQFAVTSVRTSATNATAQYDTEWLLMTVILPSNVAFAGYPGEDTTKPQDPATNPCGCWFQIRYSLGGGNATDTTTWRIDLAGDPVHLVL